MASETVVTNPRKAVREVADLYAEASKQIGDEEEDGVEVVATTYLLAETPPKGFERTHFTWVDPKNIPAPTSVMTGAIALPAPDLAQATFDQCIEAMA